MQMSKTIAWTSRFHAHDFLIEDDKDPLVVKRLCTSWECTGIYLSMQLYYSYWKLDKFFGSTDSAQFSAVVDIGSSATLQQHNPDVRSSTADRPSSHEISTVTQ